MTFTLRDFIPKQDIRGFHRAHSDDESMRYYGMSPTKSLDESKKLLFSYINSMRSKISIHRVIYDTDTMKYCGEIGLFNIDNIHHRANSYCILLSEYRKKGISKLISKEFYTDIFAHTELNRIQAYVDSRNVNAKNSLVGIGYKYEGRLQQYEYDRNEYIDIDVYALLRNKFTTE